MGTVIPSVMPFLSVSLASMIGTCTGLPPSAVTNRDMVWLAERILSPFTSEGTRTSFFDVWNVAFSCVNTWQT